MTYLILIIKIIGIILAVILGIALLLILLILFVPVKYQGRVSYDKDADFKFRAAWLMQLIEFKYEYPEDESESGLYILGRKTEYEDRGTEKNNREDQ